MKKEEKQEWDANTLHIPYYHSMTLPTVIHNTFREGWTQHKQWKHGSSVGICPHSINEDNEGFAPIVTEHTGTYVTIACIRTCSCMQYGFISVYSL